MFNEIIILHDHRVASSYSVDEAASLPLRLPASRDISRRTRKSISRMQLSIKVPGDEAAVHCDIHASAVILKAIKDFKLFNKGIFLMQQACIGFKIFTCLIF